MSKLLFVKQQEREILEHLLRGMKVGESKTYEELANACGLDAESVRPVLDRARRSVECEGIVFGTIVKVGIRRLNNVEVVDSCDSFVVRVRRAAARAVRRLTRCVDYDELPQDMQVKHNTRLAQMGATAVMSDRSSEKRLSKYIESSNERPSIGRTLELLGDDEQGAP